MLPCMDDDVRRSSTCRHTSAVRFFVASLQAASRGAVGHRISCPCKLTPHRHTQVAINWTICKGALPIPGAKNARQAKEAAGAAPDVPPFDVFLVQAALLPSCVT